ncbi:DUF3168 domain-containing protein [Sphingomonas paeninsulae]|uniref:DUF3168 domain-containing protein n=1 Tax=Sphingomonas paeninsulae TaxID=2319844 RepID=A0A494TJH6_SPHPE|nr:DUF3168 domain-containing protein [Sphingomonas paeninsulae]AYJ87664.1 DUF3168 domain-containing protein [Sphingomonas paeninsulae]
MANDPRLPVRRSVVALLRSDAPLSVMVDVRTYGPETPANVTWPFNRYGSATYIPERATCMDGAKVFVSVHSFARGPGEDAASAIAARIAKILDGATLVLENGDEATVTVTGGQTLRDTDEASAWHCTTDIEVTVVSQ